MKNCYICLRMKRILTLAALLPGLFVLAGCQRVATQEPSPKTYTITASLEASTRTVLHDGTKVFWKPQDQIAVFDGNGVSRFTAAIDQEAPVADFEGTTPVTLDGSMLYAVYPFSEASACENGRMRAELPAVQQALAGSFDDDLLVTAARSTDARMAFYNACSGIRFTLSTEGVRRVIVRSNGGEPIAGTLQMYFDENGALQADAAPGGTSQVVLNAPAGEVFQTGVSYYVILAPCTLERGLTMEFLTPESACCKTLEKRIELKRSVFGILWEADSCLEWDPLASPDSYLFNADPATDYLPEYWDAARRITFYNVQVPVLGSTASADCIYLNNLNAPFSTWPEGSPDAGQLKLANTGGYNIKGIRYHFSASMTQVTSVGSLTVSYTVSADGQTLYAALDGGAPEAVAVIDNLHPQLHNSFSVIRSSSVARALVNSGRFHVLIGARGYLCNNPNYEVRIAFNRRPHFEASIVPPLQVSGTALDSFIDGSDFGEKGSFIRLEDLVDLKDWRSRSFSDYPNYWDYYGPFSFTADLANVLCCMEGVTTELPVTIELGQNNLPSMGAGASQKTSRFGFLTYHNNGLAVNDFELLVPVTVTYGWGELSTGHIRIPVQGTTLYQ